MAKVFISYDGQDRNFARSIEKGLKEKGHRSVWGVDELIAGKGWGELMPKKLANADAVITLLTPNSTNTRSVWCEIGASRILSDGVNKTALLPVIKGLKSAPGYTNEILVLWSDEKSIQQLVTEIDTAIQAHLEAIELEASRSCSPKIFISHRHKDQAIAKALTEMISSAFLLKSNEIRCTSVQPYRLPFGKNTADRLREEILAAEVVLGLLSPDTADSSYVMFELGAAWSQKVYTCPLLCRGAEFKHIPGPIFDLTPARLWQQSDCQQLISNLEAELSLTKNEDPQISLRDSIVNLSEVSKPK